MNLKEANENIDRICDLVERINAPNPLNPCGISDNTYDLVMTNLHNESRFSAKHGIGGSDLDMNRYEPDELAEHNRNLLAAIEYDRVQTVKRGGNT
jgi:hypothetical protein